MSDLRDKIARALFDDEVERLNGALDAVWEFAQSWESLHPHQRELWLEAADAVLAVLADLPESVIERAAPYTLAEAHSLAIRAKVVLPND